MRRLLRFIGLVLLIQTEALAAKPSPPATGPVAIDVPAMQTWTKELSSDAYEGRAPGTGADAKTVDWIADAMRKAGLKPGMGTSFLQPVPLVATRFESSFRLRFAGAKSAEWAVANGEGIVAWTKRTSGEAAVRGSAVVFAGYGISAPERGHDDYASLDVTGKTVIVLVNDPDWRAPGLTGPFGGRAMTRYGRWDYKHDEAARRGAVAVLVVHQTDPAGYPWSVVANSWTGPQLDAERADGGASRPAFEGWIDAATADRLLKPAGGLAALEAAAARPGFKALSLPWALSASAKVATRRFTSHNVVGVLPGRFRPDEVVLTTAHWDHLGRCPPAPDGDSICNGAVDNASGVAGMLALAKAHAAAGPAARTLAFIAWTGEESGLLGSDYYARNPVFPLKQTVGGVNIDGLSFLGRTSDAVFVGAGQSELEDLARAIVARQSRRVEPEPSPQKGFYYRSDHYSLAKGGVPMLYPKGGVDVRGKGRAYGQAAQDEYTAKRYHTPKDEYSPDWDWSGAVEDLALDYELTRALANGRGWPAWRPGSEFRAARDESRAGLPSVSPESEAEIKARGKRQRGAPPAGPRPERVPL